MLSVYIIRHATTIAALLLTSITLVSPASAGERPIAGVGSGFFLPPEYPTEAEVRGPGEVDHLGRCTLNVTFDPLAILIDRDALVPLAVQFWSASQDLLYASVEGFQFDPLMGAVAVSIHFTGGTGRFADASGKANLLIVFDDWQGGFSHANVVWSLAGTIDY